MDLSSGDCCVLNGGPGSWAFAPLAYRLSSCLGIEVSDRPRRFNYLLHLEDANQLVGCKVFIPVEAIRMASDKRLLAVAFAEHGVPTPETHLLEGWDQVIRFVGGQSGKEWCLKYPTGCGGSGHRMITEASATPPNWPSPFIVQEFVRLDLPEVYRTYCTGGEMFGWVARRFPEGVRSSPWVAHARGARYVRLNEMPGEALQAARRAVLAAGLGNSFGCVDLLQKPRGEWVVLEVGTDGLYNHVDRDLGDEQLERELDQRLADAFWRAERNCDHMSAVDHLKQRSNPH
jgi:glutathione synthase/RimK-type ligase-like ATP-grasp enzyme